MVTKRKTEGLSQELVQLKASLYDRGHEEVKEPKAQQKPTEALQKLEPGGDKISK